jgi:hypothetical protein
MGRVTGAVRPLTSSWARLPAAAGLVAGAQAEDAADRRWPPSWPASSHPHPGRRVRAQGRLLGDAGQLLHAGGLVAGGHRGCAPAGRRRAARVARGAPHRHHHQQRLCAGQDLRLASTCAWSTARTASAASTSWSVPMREKLARIPGITVTNIGVTDLGGGKSLQFSIQGPTSPSWSAWAQIMPRLQPPSRAWWTWTARSSPTSPRWRWT